MIDMIISFLSFILLSIRGFIGNFVFRPPQPSSYITSTTEKDKMITEVKN
jgi:hypothetical protein